MSRFEEVVGEAIDEVVLSEAPFHAETPRRPHRRAGPGEPARPALGGLGGRPLPRDGPRAGLRPGDPGDLHPLRHRGLLAARHPHPDRRPGPGHDRLPMRPGDGRRRRPRAPRRARLRPRAGLRDRRGRPDRHPQPAWHRHPLGRLPRGLRGRHRRPRAAADRRAVDELGDLRADEAPGRAGGGDAGALPTPLRRGLRPRDDPPRDRGPPRPRSRRLRDGPPGEPGDDPPPQRRRRALRRARGPAPGARGRRALRSTT